MGLLSLVPGPVSGFQLARKCSPHQDLSPDQRQQWVGRGVFIQVLLPSLLQLGREELLPQVLPHQEDS